jgi:hypothetical protein
MGKEMIVWDTTKGAAYNPKAHKWKELRTWDFDFKVVNSCTAIWTGKEMIIWGGRCGGVPMYCSDGASYRPWSNKN